MTTNTAGSSAREYPMQMVHYLRRTVTYATSSISTGVKLGTLPKGGKILQDNVIVETAFNGSSGTLTVGTNSTSFDNIHSSLTQTQMAATVNYVATACGVLTFTQDTDVYIKFTAGATTAPTAGQATVILRYVPNNDQ
jgi:hypothetical protein